jgi:hypothetical protein
MLASDAIAGQFDRNDRPIGRLLSAAWRFAE